MRCRSIILILFSVLSLAFSPWLIDPRLISAEDEASQPSLRDGAPSNLPPGDQIQLTAAGHVLGFDSSGVWIAAADHALHQGFVDANPVPPRSGESTALDGDSWPLSRVTYAGLWTGVNLVYEATPSGVLNSTYMLAPGADVGAVRLQYNKSPVLGADGALHFQFRSGEMVETRPIAWQDIGGVRIPVDASYHLYGRGEVGFDLGRYDPHYPLVIDPTIHWITFLGASFADQANSVVLKNNDNYVYVTGTSEASWGTNPERTYSGEDDAFVAKLDSDGDLVWHTFLGGAGDDRGFSIEYDPSGSLYITGESSASWGSPVRAYQGGYDVFVAKLSASTGAIVWSTFLGSAGEDYGLGIYWSSSSGLLVTGFSTASWGSPIRAFSGSFDAFVALLPRTTGSLSWNTFLGSSAADRGMDILGNSTGIYLIGYSSASWGSPYRPYYGSSDAFVAKLNNSGTLLWNTFLGSSSSDNGYAITLDGSSNVYVVGKSMASWQGSYPPLRAYSGNSDVFVTKLNSNGLMLWNTFLGSSEVDLGYGIAVDDANDSIYIAGTSYASWDSPVVPHAGGGEAFLTRLDIDGNLEWTTFLGSEGYDSGYDVDLNNIGVPIIVGESAGSYGNPRRLCSGEDAFVTKVDTGGNWMSVSFLGAASDDDGRAVAFDDEGNIYITGYSQGRWGSPKRSHRGNYDAFVAKLDRYGVLLWNTFLGGTEDDKAFGVTVNNSGYVYVTGESSASWGSPVRAYSGAKDAFVAKLDSAGNLQWNTFLGSASNDTGYGVDLYSGGNFNVVGVSYATWGTPRRAYSGGSDAFIAEIDDAGNLVWNSFMGGGYSDHGRGLVVDNVGNVFLTGTSTYTWGTPIRSHAGMGVPNAFVARVSSSGYLSWNTFLGSTQDYGLGIDRDLVGNVYVTGTTYQGWGFPIRSCTVNYDAFVAKLSYSGSLLWNTCLGHDVEISEDTGYGITVGRFGDAYVIGSSRSSWGTPIHPYTGGDDVFIAQLGTNGDLVWNTFQGSAGSDTGYDIIVDNGGTLYATGTAFGSFGDPLNATAGDDAFLFRLDSWPLALPLVSR
ncbi:MAG: SBBP repeat-containing protein [Anaerolineales bacterium]|jgi:hypothetical protein